ncbi:Uncharacterized protein Rs2_04214 [Raphanus sativus]|nr:Uncharacterized protein Rs2_04214 [Raphanus sativus]
MSEIDGLRMDIGSGGLMSYKRGKFSYSGGFVRDLFIQPDLLTWSIFEDFIADRGIKSKVEQMLRLGSCVKKLKFLVKLISTLSMKRKNDDGEKSEDENRKEVSDGEETNENEMNDF